MRMDDYIFLTEKDVIEDSQLYLLEIHMIIHNVQIFKCRLCHFSLHFIVYRF